MAVRLIHQTDIFHPHGDPDDHWDLATVYALAAEGAFDLRGILFDYPPPHRAGGPATLAMAQLGFLTGVTGVPYAIGAMHKLRDRHDAQLDRVPRQRAAAEWLCRVLEESPEPVVLTSVGACTDIAIAGLLRPDLFRAKCQAVYLNSGAANPGKEGELEYNVKQNPNAYAAVLDLPCPVYWCPCWHRTEMREVGENGTWYSFRQGEVLAELDDMLCNYFLYMLSRSADPKYLRYLSEPVNPELKAEFGEKPRSMWSTAAILHAAGMGVDAARGLLPSGQVKDPVFDFVPISLSCADDGQTTWSPTDDATDRHIFQIRYPDLYPRAMAEALATLLGRLAVQG